MLLEYHSFSNFVYKRVERETVQCNLSGDGEPRTHLHRTHPRTQSCDLVELRTTQSLLNLLCAQLEKRTIVYVPIEAGLSCLRDQLARSRIVDVARDRVVRSAAVVVPSEAGPT